jgi:tRNA/tmRNA/rRNA uracil-C5-methylase (TrmA/RlmC/RlmD family)
MGWGVGRVKLEPPPPPASSEEEGESGNGDDQEEKKEEDLRLWVVMVPHVIVGDLVQVRIFWNYKGYSEADLMQVVEASEHQVEPKCALAGRCGGCQYQHMSIDAQRDWKTKHVEEVLLQQHIAGYDNNNNDDKDQEQQKDLSVLPTLGTDEVFGYRSKITPHYEAPKEVLTTIDDTTTVTTYEMGPIGFQQSANRNLVDVLQCPIASPALNEKLQETRDRLHQQAPEGLLNIKKRRRNVAVVQEWGQRYSFNTRMMTRRRENPWSSRITIST